MQFLDHSVVGKQLRLLLIEVTDLNVGAAADVSVIRCKSAAQDLQKSGFSAAVGSDDRDALTAADMKMVFLKE